MDLELLLNPIASSLNSACSSQPQYSRSSNSQEMMPLPATTRAFYQATPLVPHLKNIAALEPSESTINSSRCIDQNHDTHPFDDNLNRSVPSPIRSILSSVVERLSSNISQHAPNTSIPACSPTSILALAQQNVARSDYFTDSGLHNSDSFSKSKLPFPETPDSHQYSSENNLKVSTTVPIESTEILSQLHSDKSKALSGKIPTLENIKDCHGNDGVSHKRARPLDTPMETNALSPIERARPLKRLNLTETAPCGSNNLSYENPSNTDPKEHERGPYALDLLANISGAVQASPSGKLTPDDFSVGGILTPSGKVSTSSGKKMVSKTRRISSGPPKPKRFECGCGKRFSKREHLKRHESLVHKLERPFACNTCDAHFGTKQNMEVHFTTRKHLLKAASMKSKLSTNTVAIVSPSESINASSPEPTQEAARNS